MHSQIEFIQFYWHLVKDSYSRTTIQESYSVNELRAIENNSIWW
jgi:hypothetical protein